MTNTATKTDLNPTQKLLIKSAVVDFLLGALKVLVGIVANSHALIADGIHSLSDLATDVMVWFFNQVGMQAPDDDHPYGHARFETFGTFVLGVILIGLAALLIYDSVDRLMNITTVEVPAWPALAAAFISILAKEWLFQITKKLGESTSSKLLIANAWHHRSDALSSVIVMIGVLGAQFGYAWFEMLAAIGVALMIAQIGWSLTRQSVDELVDTAASEAWVQSITEHIREVEGVRGVHSLRTRRMGPDVLADIHLQVNPAISVSEGHHIGEWVTRTLLENFNELNDVIVHIDAEDDEETEPRNKELIPPLRREVRNQLLAAWKSLVSEDDIEKLTLHYLNNRVDAELFLTREKVQDDIDRETLKDAARHLPWLNRVSVWFG
ncbi:MAG: cation transporter [Pseudomonadales bacterium]|nr:cation transporter [Pseudomonadales bacterium]